MKRPQSWTAEFSSAFKKLDDLYTFLEWKLDPSLSRVEKVYPLFIPMRLAKKIKDQGPEGVLAREFLPHEDELLFDQGLIDPIGDKTHQVAPQLIHRYFNRALFTPTSICPIHCRYCFRKNELNASDDLFQQDFEKTLVYLKTHPEISELIFTGGDPLTLSNEKLGRYLQEFSQIPTLKDIRFHTRYPVILPERLDEGLLNLLKKYTTIFRTVTVAIHANHADEFDLDSFQCIKDLSLVNVQLLSQTVLLKDVNDDAETLIKLMNLFLDHKVRPYYLHHPDQVKGGSHFMLPISRGRTIYAELRSKLPGWALPHYIIDIPGGEGKVSAFNPESLEYSGFFLNLKGDKVAVTEPEQINRLH